MNKRSIFFRLLGVDVIIAVIYGILVYIVLLEFRQNNIDIYLLATVNFLFGLWVGILLSNERFPLQRALLSGIISAIVMLITASLIVGVGDIILGTPLNALEFNIFIIWLIGGSFFLLWIFLGALIRLL